MAGNLKLLAATHLAVLGAGYYLAPKQPLDTIVKDEGWFKHTTSQVLSTTVDSLRNENRLLVMSYTGSVTVRAHSSLLWIFHGRQDLNVPASVPFYLDLSRLTLADVDFNEKAKIVTVRLSRPVLGTIAFDVEHATTLNGGVLTWSEAEIESLRKFNFQNARRAFVMQAQQPVLVEDAKRQAQADITSIFEVPLRISGLPDVKVVTTFK